MEQLNRIKSYVAIARERAPRCSPWWATKTRGAFQNGYFFQPTIFSDVDNSMRVAQEEIFGPVTCAITFKDDDDLLRQANDTMYGLSAGI